MPIWRRLLDFFRGRREAEAKPARETDRVFHIDEGVVQSINNLASREQLPTDEFTHHLLSQAVLERQAADEQLERWRGLTPREQQVVALICLNYTSVQIADRLAISTETVKSHARNALVKFGMHNRQELRMAMANWDFTNWVDPF